MLRIWNFQMCCMYLLDAELRIYARCFFECGTREYASCFFPACMLDVLECGIANMDMFSQNIYKKVFECGIANLLDVRMRNYSCGHVFEYGTRIFYMFCLWN